MDLTELPVELWELLIQAIPGQTNKVPGMQTDLKHNLILLRLHTH
jgi:hypothetical protein